MPRLISKERSAYRPISLSRNLSFCFYSQSLLLISLLILIPNTTNLSTHSLPTRTKYHQPTEQPIFLYYSTTSPHCSLQLLPANTYCTVALTLCLSFAARPPSHIQPDIHIPPQQPTPKPTALTLSRTFNSTEGRPLFSAVPPSGIP